ncbi:MAG: DUF86 domain-containing protein [Cyclobacteriaceae bacterium]|nr:DUF86 domain-containing protein [Cyclobacteriaceae bacterium]
MKSHQIIAPHILGAIDRIEEYTKGMSQQQFLSNFLVQDAVIRNIAVIAIDIKNTFPEIPWRKIIAMRNKVIHEYFGIDLETLWNVVEVDMPELKIHIAKIRENEWFLHFSLC